jgi:hypothetical protein
MKRIHLIAVAGVISITLIFASAQPRKSIEVTSQTLARQPRSKPYVMDLTRKGKTYKVDANIVSRVRIRTSQGETALSDLMKKLEVTSTKVLIGSASDLRALNFGVPPNRTSPTAMATNFKCDPVLPVCECDGFGDCIALSFQCDVMLCPTCEGRNCPEGKTMCFCFKGPIVISE